jgi:hypothetical protein
MIKNKMIILFLAVGLLSGCASTTKIVKVPEIIVKEKIVYCQLNPLFLEHEKLVLSENGKYTYLELEKELIKIIKKYQNKIEFIKLSECIKK